MGKNLNCTFLGHNVAMESYHDLINEIAKNFAVDTIIDEFSFMKECRVQFK